MIFQELQTTWTSKKRECLMKKIIVSQFNYFSLIWIFHGREVNKRIYELHERALRHFYKEKKATYDKLLQGHNSIRVHHLYSFI